MKDINKTKKQLVEELEVLRARVVGLELVEQKGRDAEGALLGSERIYRNLVESTVDWVWAIDEEGNHTFSNHAIKELLGYEVDMIVGASAFPLMHPDDQERIRGMVQQAIQRKSGWAGIPIRWLHKDGSTRYFESTAQPILNDEEELSGFNGIDRDITERKLVEEALQESEEKYRRLYSSMNEGVALHAVIIDEHGKAVDYVILDVNPAYESITGLKKNQVVGHNASEIYGMGQPPNLEVYLEVASSGQPTTFEATFEPAGRTFSISVFSPGPGQFATIFTDITERVRAEEELKGYRTHLEELVEERAAELQLTIGQLQQQIVERKQAEKALRESEARYRAILEALPDMMFRLSQEGTHVDYHTPSLDMLVVSPDEFMNRSVRDTLPSDVAIKYMHYIHKALQEGGVQLFEYELEFPHQDKRFFESRMTPCGTDDVLTVVRDITERKRAEEALTKTKTLLQSVLDQSPIGIAITAPEGTIEMFNSAARRLYALEDAPGFPLGENLHTLTPSWKIYDVEGQPVSYTEMPMALALQGKATRGREVRIVGSDGVERWAIQHGTPVHDQDGNLIAGLVVGTDITERKQAEEALRQYTARLEAMQELSRAILAAGSPREISQAALHHVRQLIPCQRASVAIIDFEQWDFEILAVESTDEFRIEAGIRRPIDERSYGSLKLGMPVVLQDRTSLAEPHSFAEQLQREGLQSLAMIPLMVHERIIGTLNVMADKVEAFTVEHLEIAGEVANQLAIALQQAQHLIAERHERLKSQTLRATAETLASSLNLDETLNIVISESGKIVEYDRAMVLLAEEGTLRVAASNEPSKPEPFIEEPRRVMNFSLFTEAMNAREPVAIMDTRTDPRWRGLPQGWSSELSWLGAPLVASDTVLGLLSVGSHKPDAFDIDDIEAMKAFANQAAIAVRNAHIIAHLEDSLHELKQAQQRLIQTSRLTAAGEVAAGVAHQINNPVGVIIVHAHLLMKELAQDTLAYESAETIKRAAYRAGSVVQRMLNLSRTLDYKIETVDVNISIQNAVSLLRAQIEPNIARLLTNLTPNLPVIEASQEHLEDVWLNLLLNARDAVAKVENGQIKIGSFLNTDSDVIEITVQDNGTGISSDDMEHIFEPFFTTKVYDRGTGLGLAICHEIITRHGGTIRVQSERGQGTTFTIKLPLNHPNV